jgi:ammonium transporter Rh
MAPKPSENVPLAPNNATDAGYDATNLEEGDTEGVRIADADGHTTKADFFCIFVGVLQPAFVVFYWTCTETHYNEDPSKIENLNFSFLYYFGVVVMMLIGFGYLMTFLKRAGLSAVGFTFIITMICVQTDIFAEGFFGCLYSGEWAKIKLDLGSLINGNFAAAACLISFGAIIGKAGMQCMAPLFVLETIFYALNKKIILESIGLVDIGGTVKIHMFGAYFGLAASYVLGMPMGERDKDPNENDSNRQSDVFSLIGTTFLWIFWPAFNAATAPMNSPMQQRCIMNTIISLTACCTWTFVLTRSLNGKKFSTVDVQNATLAGGVMIGCVSNYILHPAGACIIGMIAATISVFAYNLLMPNWTEKHVHDTCGINNLHGLPSIAGAITSIILAAASDQATYSAADQAIIFPQGDHQAIAQAWGSLATLVVGCTSGAFSMLLCRNVLQYKVTTAPLQKISFSSLQSLGDNTPSVSVGTFKDINYWDVDYRDFKE